MAFDIMNLEAIFEYLNHPEPYKVGEMVKHVNACTWCNSDVECYYLPQTLIK